MAWNDNLLPNQTTAAAHVGTHARLLAGPGTGKTLTLTRRICFLVTERNISAEKHSGSHIYPSSGPGASPTRR